MSRGGTSTIQDAPITRVRAVHCALFVRLLHTRGLDPGDCLKTIGLAPEDLCRLQASLTADQYVTFLQACIEQTGDPFLGLQAGQLVRLEDLDLFGLLARSLPTGTELLGAAAELFRAWQQPSPSRAWKDAVDVRTSLEPGALVVEHNDALLLAPPRHWAEYVISYVVTVVRLLMGNVAPSEVRFRHPAPRVGIRPYTHMLRCPIHFDAPRTQVRFPPSLLAQRMPHADPVAVRILRPRVARLRRSGFAPAAPVPQCTEQPHVAARASPLLTRVKTVVRALAESGQLSLTEVATRLGYSERTLRRHLHHRGTNYQAVVDAIRSQLAMEYLDRGMPGARISERLGFADPGAFYRAFRRWTGTTVSDFKARRQHDRADGAVRDHL